MMHEPSIAIPFQAVLNAMAIEMALVDESGTVAWANEPWQKFGSDSLDDQPKLPGIGMHYSKGWEHAAALGHEEAARIIEGVAAWLAGTQPDLYLEYSRPGPEQQRWYLLRGSPIADGHALLWHVNITARKSAELAALEQASHDYLTHLPNRSSIFSRLETLLKDRDRPWAIAIADIDQLKDLNDSLGHLKGDQAIMAVARSLQQDGVEVGRIGGDEFLVLIPRLTPRLASSYTSAVNTTLLRHDRTGQCRVSIGFAYFPRDGSTAGALVEAADKRMYSAKIRKARGPRRAA